MLVKSDIISILTEAFHQPSTLRKGNTQLLFECPICNRHDGIKKLEICIEGEKLGYSHCWRCNFKTRFFGALLKKLNAPKHLRDKMFELSGEIKKVRTYKKKIGQTDLRLPDEFIPISSAPDGVEYRNVLFYLKTRGIGMVDIMRYNIGFAETGKFAQQLIIPSYDIDNKLNFYIGRKYYEDDSGYRYTKADFSNDIVGFENLINYNCDINLCEGSFDAISIRNNAIPLFGKYPQKKLQEKLISNGVKRVNMILDNDALEDAIKNCELLWKYGVNVHLIKLDGKDPSKLGFEKVHKLIKDSVPFEWENLMRYKLSKI
jgi:hypothetical protein